MHQFPMGLVAPRGRRHGDQAAAHQAPVADASRTLEPAQHQREAEEHHMQEEEETAARTRGAELRQEHRWNVAAVESPAPCVLSKPGGLTWVASDQGSPPHRDWPLLEWEGGQAPAKWPAVPMAARR